MDTNQEISNIKNANNNFSNLLIIVFSTLYAIAFNQNINLSGDEVYYWELFEEIKSNINSGNLSYYFFDGSIKHGYFVPGVSYVLTFFYYIFDSLGLSSISTYQTARFFITIFNSLIFALICLNARKITGRFNVLPFLCLLIPYYSFYSGALWGEAIATNLAILSIVLFENNIRELKANSYKKLLSTLILWSILSLSLLTRPQYSALVIVFFLRWLMSVEKNNFKLNMFAIPLLGLITILSWNMALKDKFGSFFMSISPSEYQFVIDKDYSKQAKESTGVQNDWYSVDRYLKAKAKDSNLTLSEVIKIEKEHLKKYTFNDKVVHQVEQLNNFYFRVNDFLKRFYKIGNSSYLNENVHYLLIINKLASYGLFLLSWILFLIPFKNNIMMSFYYKTMFFFITSQSAFYFSHGRYYISLIVLTMLFLIFIKANNYSLKDKDLNIWKLSTIRFGYAICWVYFLYHLLLLAYYFF